MTQRDIVSRHMYFARRAILPTTSSSQFWNLLDEAAATRTPPQPPHRGALASLGVTIAGAEILQLRHPSGLERSGGTVVATQPVVTHMVLRLEQQRRPPLQDCWLVKEVLDVRYAFAGDMGNEIPE